MHLRFVLLCLVLLLPLSLPAGAAMKIEAPAPDTVAVYDCSGIVNSRIIHLYLPRPDGRVWLQKHSGAFGSTKVYFGNPIDLHLDTYSLFSELYTIEAEYESSRSRRQIGEEIELGGKYTLLSVFDSTSREQLSVVTVAEKFINKTFRGKTVRTIRLERESKSRLATTENVRDRGTFFAAYSPELKLPLEFGRIRKNQVTKRKENYTCKLAQLTDWDAY